MGFILGLVIGLVVGWNFFPQPQAVADLIAKAKAKIGM